MPIRLAAHNVVIAVDPHKASWTAVAVDERLQPLGAIRALASREGYRQLRRFARRWPDATWAIEGAMGLGAPLTARLAEDGIEVLDGRPSLPAASACCRPVTGARAMRPTPCRSASPRTPPPICAPPGSTNTSRPCGP